MRGIPARGTECQPSRECQGQIPTRIELGHHPPKVGLAELHDAQGIVNMPVTHTTDQRVSGRQEA